MSEKTAKAPMELTKKSLSDVNAVCELVNKMNVSNEEMVANYFDFEISECYRLIPIGVSRIQKAGTDEETDAIKFIYAADGEVYISAAKVLVTALKESAELARDNGELKPVEVTCIGEKKSAKGAYQKFSIKRLH